MISLFKVLFVLILVLCANIAHNTLMSDVCDTDDSLCLRPNIEMGDLQYTKCQIHGILRRIHQSSLLQCVKECFLTSQCTGINFRKDWSICDVTSNSSYSENFVTENGCIHSDINTWSQSMAGKCSDHKCATGQRCYYIDNTCTCKDEYCTNLPSVPNAVVVEKFGAFRNINTGIQYSCVRGFVMKDRPLAVCRGHTNWEVLFSCIPERCVVKGYESNVNHQFCLKVYKTKGMTWSKARETCQKDQGDLISIQTLEKWNIVVDYMKQNGINNGWIGMKNMTWVTGETFSNVFGVQIQLNNYDSAYLDDDSTCVALIPDGTHSLQDESCNERLKIYFLCEMMW